MAFHAPDPMTSDESSGSNNLPLASPEQAATASDWLNATVEAEKHLTGYKLTNGGGEVPEREMSSG